MAYCTHEEVGILLGLTFDESSSKPKASKVEIIIELISSELNLTIKSAGITLPTSGDFYNLVKLKCMQGSAGVVGVTYYGNTEDVIGSQGDYYKKEYMSFLIDIKKNPDNYKGSTSEVYVSNQVLAGYETQESISEVLIGNDWVD